MSQLRVSFSSVTRTFSRKTAELITRLVKSEKGLQEFSTRPLHIEWDSREP